MTTIYTGAGAVYTVNASSTIRRGMRRVTITGVRSGTPVLSVGTSLSVLSRDVRTLLPSEEQDR